MKWLSVLTNLPLNDNKEPWPEAMPSFRGCCKSGVAGIGLRLFPAVENARMLMMQISQATELENRASISQTVCDLCRYYFYTSHQVHYLLAYCQKNPTLLKKKNVFAQHSISEKCYIEKKYFFCTIFYSQLSKKTKSTF